MGLGLMLGLGLGLGLVTLTGCSLLKRCMLHLQPPTPLAPECLLIEVLVRWAYWLLMSFMSYLCVAKRTRQSRYQYTRSGWAESSST